MRHLLALALVATAAASPLLAQGAPQMRVAPSTRATTTMNIGTGVRGAAPLTVKVDYGQPFARGRAVEGTLIPADTIWRTGANAATAFTTDVNLRIGDLAVPKGSYTLYSRWSPKSGMQLVVNKQTGQWGTEYSQAQDLGRTAMTRRELPDAQDAFVIALVPNAEQGQPLGGTLRMAWGKSEFSVPVVVVP
ncbi:MAG: DUF2911 domain-containing protein [Gemmatimonadaceae bacterium]|jgi:hypothetical protein|nr:DUF2911 domain-containing protein [Gemmatimonadaceae bacterium]